ncbi:MAG: hypothetical protein ABSA32_04460 [Candidatus Acidiferrales bacterium]
MPRTRPLACVFLATLISSSGAAGPASGSPAGDQPLQVIFSVGATFEFRIQLAVTARVDGEQTETIGAKTYVAPFAREAKSVMTWRAQIRVLSVSADGAEIEESLDSFAATPAEIPADPQSARMAQALNAALSGWSQERTIRYRETPSGQTLGIPPDAAPPLDEQSPRLLSAWLLRALRPAAVLPARPMILNDHWQDARAIPPSALPNWSGASGWESGQWLASASGSKLQVRLDDVQQVSAIVASGPEKPPEGVADASFRGESLSTIALDDARLVAASRSAARAIVWTLTPAAGLSAPPQFSARLTIEIDIENCDETSCDNLHSELRGNR